MIAVVAQLQRGDREDIFTEIARRAHEREDHPVVNGSCQCQGGMQLLRELLDDQYGITGSDGEDDEA